MACEGQSAAQAPQPAQTMVSIATCSPAEAMAPVGQTSRHRLQAGCEARECAQSAGS